MPYRQCGRLLLFVLLILAACTPSGDAHTVTLIADGKRRELTTEALTVRDVLEEADVRLEAEDRVTPAEPTLVRNGMTVRVIRVETQEETVERVVPYGRRTVHDASIPVGESQLLEPGLTGIEELTYRLTLEDGVEVDRRLVRQRTIREARTEVILVGAQTEHSSVSVPGTMTYIANHNAWLMRKTSLNQRRLTFQGDLDGRVFSLSPDGSHLLFTRVPTETTAIAPVSTLWVVDTTTANARPVRVAADSVLWATWQPGCEVAHTTTRCRIAYSTGTTVEGNPGWRADNDLWMARLRPSTGELYSEREVVEPEREGSYSWWGTTYAWSPDGRSFAYARADEVGVVRVYDRRQKTLRRFAPYQTYAPWVWTPSVSWSPESGYLVTTLHGPAPTGQAPEDSPVFDVWALSADGTITAELASEAGMWSAPAFAPQSGLIAFGRARSPYASHNSSYDLYVMDRDGSDRRLVFPTGEEMGLEYPEMSWSPRGDQIVAVYRENLFLIGVPDGDVAQLTVNGGVTAVEWQPGSWEESERIVEPPGSGDPAGPEDDDPDSEQGPTPD